MLSQSTLLATDNTLCTLCSVLEYSYKFAINMGLLENLTQQKIFATYLINLISFKDHLFVIKTWSLNSIFLDFIRHWIVDFIKIEYFVIKNLKIKMLENYFLMETCTKQIKILVNSSVLKRFKLSILRKFEDNNFFVLLNKKSEFSYSRKINRIIYK